MKKLSISLLIALMGLGFVSCSDDDDSSAGKNGDKCTQNSDCASNYCESGKCAPAKAADGSKCKVDSDCVSNLCQQETCVAQKNDKRDDGQECESNDDCKSNKCDETTHKCVAAESEKKADGADCTAADECKSNKCEAGKCVAAESEKKADGADCTAADECKSNKCEAGKCVAAESEKKADGADCAAHDECNSSICHQGKCGLPSTCSVSDEDYCAGNIYVHCDVDLTTGGEAENEPTFVVNACGQSKACVVSGTNKGCFETCTKAGESKTECDKENNTTEDNHPKELVSYQCTQVDDKLVFVVDKTKDCGNALCDTFTNSCSGEAAVGVKCQDDNQCKSSYCDKAADATQGVCADKKAADAECTRDSACQSGYCKESTHKCTARAENDAACDVNADCTSNFCKKTGDAAKGTCATKPSGYEENGKACENGSKCISGYCDGSVCADKPKASVGECSDTKKCEGNKVCSKDFKCVAKAGEKGGYGDTCADDTKCAEGLKCNKGKCGLEDEVTAGSQECTSESVSCVGNVKLGCGAIYDSPDPGPWDEPVGYSKNVKACAQDGNVCVKSGKVADCMAPCDKVGASYQLCTTVDDYYDHLTTYTCTDVDGVKVFVPSSVACDCNADPNNNYGKCTK